jgi:DNA-binding beta-propeller fold protein YncE
MKKAIISCILLFILILSLGCSDNNVPTNTGNPQIQSAAECKNSLCLTDSISLLELQDSPIDENVLKIFSAAVDPVRNRVYVSGILTPNIAIMDGATESWVGTIDSGMGWEYSLKYLHIDPVKNYLYIIDGSKGELRRIDLNNGDIKGPVPIGSRSGIAAVDTKRGRIYISSRFSPHFSVYDGSTLNLLFKTDEMGEGTGDMIYDEKKDLLYVLDFLNPKINVFDPKSNKVLEKITYDNSCCGGNSKQLAYDPEQNSFFILVARHVEVVDYSGKSLNSIDIEWGRDIERIAFEPDSKKLLILTVDREKEGQVSGVGGHLEVYDPYSVKRFFEIPFGKKPHRIEVNTTNNKIYIPNGDASILWSISSINYQKANPIRIGDSIEQVVLSKDGNKLYMNSRLGGSYLLEYDTDRKSYDTFTSGTWPIPIRVDSNGENLFVLNAWDSTLSVYSLLPKISLQSTIPLGVPKGTTDRLPDIIVDSLNHVTYVAYPEFAQIIVVDWKNNRILNTINIMEFKKGEQGGGPGDIQLAFDERTNRLIVLLTQENRIEVYDASRNYALIKKIDISSINLKKVKEGANVDLLFIDLDNNRLFVGSYEFDINTLKPSGRVLSDGQRVFAFDPKENVYWASGVRQDGKVQNDIVSVIDAETLKTRYVQTLGQTQTTKPSFAIDTNNRKLYVGYMAMAKFEIYNIGDIK